jgi:GAF domain-containing protein
MTQSESEHPRRRSVIRRQEDRDLRKQIDRYIQLFHVGQILTSELDFESLFDTILKQTTKIIDAQRCSIFIIDDDKEHLRAFVSFDLKRDHFKIPKDHGVAGWVYCNNTPVIINNAYEDPRFYPEVDKNTGFQTRSILCVPLINRSNACIGTLQVLNKKTGDFTDDDRELLTYVANYVSIALENSMLYEELKASDSAKERAIHHLAHELKTPLSIIAAVFGRVDNYLQDYDLQGLERTLARGRRNVNRLLDLQEKVGDIIRHGEFKAEEQYRNVIENISEFIDEIVGDTATGYDKIVRHIDRRTQSVFQSEKSRLESIRLSPFLKGVCDKALSACGARDVRIKAKLEEDPVIQMDKRILKKVCIGLLKNAIENTPDKGRIDVSTHCADGFVQLMIQDYGVGITPDNQKNIFSGFYHTQETAFYSSKRPYQFNAGGAGSDLLRIKNFAERYGFKINLKSKRCQYLPLDADSCPGNVFFCTHINDPQDCHSSGGTIFTLDFPEAVGGSLKLDT